MSRPESLRRVCLLALACAGLFVSGSARAGMGALWDDVVCKDPSTIANGFDFETSFVGLPDCAKLCRDAANACRRHVDDATKCQSDFAKDFISFDTSVDCAGLTGSRLRDCKDGWSLDLQIWRADIQRNQLIGRIRCEQLVVGTGQNEPGCLRRCSGQ